MGESVPVAAQCWHRDTPDSGSTARRPVRDSPFGPSGAALVQGLVRGQPQVMQPFDAVKPVHPPLVFPRARRLAQQRPGPDHFRHRLGPPFGELPRVVTTGAVSCVRPVPAAGLLADLPDAGAFIARPETTTGRDAFGGEPARDVAQRRTGRDPLQDLRAAPARGVGEDQVLAAFRPGADRAPRLGAGERPGRGPGSAIAALIWPFSVRLYS